ncbi:PhzF family phenazine biosynthesis protein [Planctomycetota bacterium]|nr:PhzF family phenazine biosynthesis protein [Planctomycetota bacterium]
MPLFQVDAFSDKPFAGNPAGVCLLPAIRFTAPCDARPPISDTWMQHIASEMNLAETAFLQALPDDPDHDYLLRWFTPAAEVELCGHATLASAHILYEHQHQTRNLPIRFKTIYSGTLTCSYTSNGAITMDFPADTPKFISLDQISPDVIKHLNISASDITAAFANPWDIILELKSESLVCNLNPNFQALIPFSERGIAVTAQASDNSPYDFVSRFFAPKLRINEDPVTGSLHCVLTPYWAAKLNKTNLTAYQASPRGGTLDLLLQSPRVSILGHACTIFKATLHPHE